jgi:hypothetical protein
MPNLNIVFESIGEDAAAQGADKVAGSLEKLRSGYSGLNEQYGKIQERLSFISGIVGGLGVSQFFSPSDVGSALYGESNASEFAQTVSDYAATGFLLGGAALGGFAGSFVGMPVLGQIIGGIAGGAFGGVAQQPIEDMVTAFEDTFMIPEVEGRLRTQEDIDRFINAYPDTRARREVRFLGDVLAGIREIATGVDIENSVLATQEEIRELLEIRRSGAVESAENTIRQLIAENRELYRW